MINKITCICGGVKTSEKETLPILFSKKVRLYERVGFGEILGSYGTEYFYCDKCNQVKVYKCSFDESVVMHKYTNCGDYKDYYYCKTYSPNPVGTKVTAIENLIDVLQKNTRK